MSFAYDRDSHAIVDPDTGDTLQQERLHYQDLRWFLTILGPEGIKKFAATVLVDADGTWANPKKPGDHVLKSAIRFAPNGQASEVTRRDPDLQRVIAYVRSRADPNKPFTFSDARNGYRSLINVGVDYRFALALGLVGFIVTAVWVFANGFSIPGD